MPVKTSAKIQNLRNNAKQKKMNKRVIESSKLHDLGDDRPFLKVKIGEHELLGLVDSGCNLICLGKNSLELLKTLDIKFTPQEGSLQTAGGNTKTVLGYIRHTISFNNNPKEFTIFICPELQQTLYLGSNFM